MTKQRDQLSGQRLRESLLQPLRDLLWSLPSSCRIRERIEPPLTRSVPAIDPVRHHQLAIGSEVDIGREQMLDVPVRVDHLVAGPRWLDRERTDSAVGCRATEVGEEKVPSVAVGHSRAGVVCQPRGAIAQVQQRRDDAGGLHRSCVVVLAVRVPDVFAVPGAAITQVLVVHSPTRIAAFHDIDPAGFVSAIGVVIPREEIAVIVEGQLLRIAKSMGKDFEVASIEIATEHRTRIGPRQQFALFVCDMIAPVSDAEVNPPVRPHLQAVHVVSTERDTYSETIGECLFRIGLSISV